MLQVWFCVDDLIEFRTAMLGTNVCVLCSVCSRFFVKTVWFKVGSRRVCGELGSNEAVKVLV